MKNYQPYVPQFSFRTWVYCIWAEHQEETLRIYNCCCEYSFDEYFKKNKFWLKKKFKEIYSK